MCSTTILAMAAVLCHASATPETGWVEDFAHPNWYAVGYTRTPARKYGFEVEDGIGHFWVGQRGKAMRWITTVPGTNLKTYRNLEIRYKATGMVTSSPSYFLYMQVNTASMKPKDPPARLNEIVADGEWHVLRKEMPRKRDAPHWLTKLVLAVHAKDARAHLWVDYIKLTAPEPEPLTPIDAALPEVGFRDDFGDVAAWRSLESVPYRGVTRATCKDGVGRFEVEGMFRNAIFERRLDPPADPSTYRHITLKYRAFGQRQVYTRYERTLPCFLTVGDPNRETRVCIWNGLVVDGAWHARTLGLPGKGTHPNGIEYIRLNLSSEEDPRAAIELDYIELTDRPRQMQLTDFFEIASGQPDAGPKHWAFPEVPVTPGASASELLQRQWGMGWLPAGGRFTVDGIPFRLRDAAHAFGVFEERTLAVEVNGRLAAAHFLMATRIEGKNDFCSWGGPTRFVEEPERFSVTIEYADGTQHESVPFNLQGRSFKMPPGPGLFGVLNPRPDTQVRRIAFADKTHACGFHLLALTLQTQGKPFFTIPPPRRLPPKCEHEFKLDPASPQIALRKDHVGLRSSYVSVALSLGKGVRLAGLSSAWLLDREMPCDGALFAIEAGDARITSADVRVTGARRTSPQGASIDFEADGLRGTLLAVYRDSLGSEITFGLSLTNTSPKPLRGKVSFAPLSGVRLDDDPGNVWLFYPGPGTIVTDEPFCLSRLQSDHFPLQVMAAWSIGKAGGLYVMTHDSKCVLDKEYALEKFDGKVTARVRFMHIDLAPGGSITLPDVALGGFQGGWRSALDVYRRWVQAWYTPIAQHPDWFRRVYTWCGITPTLQMGLDEQDRMDLSWHVDACKRFYGSCDYLHVYGWGASKDHGTQGDFCHYELLGGRESWRNALQKLHQRGVPTGLYLDPLLIDEKSFAATRHGGVAWQVLNAKGKRTRWSSGNFYVCAGLKESQEYWAKTYARVAREIAPRGLYMDQIGYWNPRDWTCYNAAHGHTMPLGMRPGQARLVRRIREAINSVDPTIASYSEFVPIDVMCQYQDGSFTHTIRHEWELPQSLMLNPLYLAFPEMRCFEIYAGSSNSVGENVRLPLRLFWGRESLYLNGDLTDYSPETRSAIRRCGEIWHKYEDAFAARNPQFLVESLIPGVLVNRYPSASHDVYLLFNELPYTVSGPVLAVQHERGCRYVEAWGDVALKPEFVAGTAQVSLTIPPKKVRCVAVER